MNIKNRVIVIFLGAVLIVSVVQAFQLNGLKNRLSTTGAVAATGTGQIDTASWTENEIMNYDMHGIIPARFGKGGSASASMVGGC